MFALGGAGNIRQINLISNMVSIVAATYLSLHRGCQFMHNAQYENTEDGEKRRQIF